LDRIFAEGLEKRWQRHREMAAYVRQWVAGRGYGFFAAEPYRSLTLTCAVNSRNTDLAALKKRLAERGFAFDDGYGKIKGETFRIPHMGDMQLVEIEEFLRTVDEFLDSL
jgi:aspartate aminotransferase-like enzyme